MGVDLHVRQQTIAMLDANTRELVEKTLEHDGNEALDFYSTLSGQDLIGIEATGPMQWFLRFAEELGIECRVGHPKKVRKAETRKQKHDWRDAEQMRLIEAETVEGVAREFQLDEVEPVAPAGSLNPTQMFSPQRHLSRTFGEVLLRFRPSASGRPTGR